MSHSTTAALTSVGTTPFYVPLSRVSVPAHSFDLVFGSVPCPEDLLPVTLFVLDDAYEVSQSSLSSIIDSWLETDDVFTADFLQHIYLIFRRGEGSVNLSESGIRIFNKWDTKVVHLLSTTSDTTNSDIRGGPYFASSKGLHEAWRLYEDTNEAFVFPVVPDDHSIDSFNIPGTAAVPIPSRCYFEKPSRSKPLSGLRVAIKDNIDLKGVKTGAGNRAYQTVYPPRTRNAACVDLLLEAGAVIIGKTKTVQFASGENARDWIDYFPPFNPRADGYQEPGGSSSGSASAESSYDWVDITVGTDTFGSVIGPAADQGLFGIRPSLGSISTEGTVPVSKLLDTIGYFTRSIQLAATVSRTLCTQEFTSRFQIPGIELLYPVDIFSRASQMYLLHIEPFILHLEAFLQTLAHIQLYDCYHNCLPFVEDYQQTFRKRPFADPYIEYKWSLGENLSKEQYEEAVEQRDTFGEWVRTSLLPQPTQGKNLDKFLIFPSDDTEAFDRHQYPERSLEEGAKRKQGFGFRANMVSVLAGLPFVTIPYGQYPFDSAVTGNLEYLPGAIGIIGPKGSEAALLELLEEIFKNTPDLPGSVLTGSTAFAVNNKAPIASL